MKRWSSTRYAAVAFALAFAAGCGTATIDGLGDATLDTGGGSSSDGDAGALDGGTSADTGTTSDAGPGTDSDPGSDVGPGTDTGGGTDAGPAACEGPNPAGCPGNACEEGLVCVRGDECLPSSCACDEATGTWSCTDDCGGGVCMEPGAPCEGDADCSEGLLCAGGACEPAGCGDEFAPVCGVDGVTYPNACTARVARVEIARDGICDDTITCEADGDCMGGLEVCEEGICVACPAVDVCDECPMYYEFADRNGCDTCDCVPIRECERDAACDGLDCFGVGTCRADCPVGDPSCCEASICQPFSTDCEGPNPAGCSRGSCDSDEVCVFDEETCLPSACSCDELSGEWLCTDDCGGGVCLPDVGGCTFDTDCPMPEVCEEGVCMEILCGRVYDPVCGVDGETYENPCRARVARVDIAYEGECRSTEICRGDFECEIGWICEDGVCTAALCPDIYDPVCGEDGRTYGNACVARAAHVEVAYDGECEVEFCRGDRDCPIPEVCERGTCVELFCLDIYDPVCGVDGETYPNECEARRARMDVAYAGVCGEVTRCRADFECPIPEVCEEGACVDLFCPDIYEPVCGVDGDTYPNECEARRAHVDIASVGECGDPFECRFDTDCISPEVCQRGECTELPCPAVFIPVCGVDGVTYGNDCEARRAHVEVAYEGPCETACESNRDCLRGEICYPPTSTCREPCFIRCLIPDPVCGEDGVTYICGEEEAWCRGVEVAYPGECFGVPIPEPEDER